MKKSARNIVLGLSVLLLVAFVFQQAFQVIKTASHAYLFGYPLVLIDVTEQTMRAGADGMKANMFVHARYFPDHNLRNVVRPNNDTLYSIAWLDLRKEPQVISVPDAGERYYVLPLMDAWSNVFARIGTSTTGNREGKYAIVGPDWNGRLPEDMKSIPSPTNRVWIIGRTQTNGEEDFAQAFQVQDGYRITALSNWSQRKQNPSAIQLVQNLEMAEVDPQKIVDSYSYDAYFDKISALMKYYPPFKRDAPMLETLAGLGIVPGKTFHAEDLNPVKRKLLAIAVEKTRKKMTAIATGDRASENGWAVVREGIGNYGSDYALRALVAKIGLGALPPEEAVYPNAAVDSQGELLSGQQRYRIHFADGNTPPVDAFWSLTLYDAKGFLINNPIRRYTIGSRNDLDFNPDGSLDIYIQNQQPEQRISNWLPSPEGEFQLTLRLYLPKDRFLDGSWKLPPIEKNE